MASAQYYASQESYDHYKSIGDRRREEARFAKATELATAALIAAHQQEYSELVQKTLASLQEA
jgi:cation transport regulator ChaB